MVDAEPGARKSPATALAVGCGLVVGLAVLSAVALGAVVGWWLYRDDPPRPEETIRDGSETSYLTCTLHPDDPAVRELVARTVDGLIRLQAQGAPVFSRPDSAAILEFFPVVLEIARYRRASADEREPTVFRIRFEGGGRGPRAAFRLASATAGGEGPLRRADTSGVPVLVAGAAEPGGITTAFVGDRLLGANRTDLLHRILAQAGRPAGPSDQAEVESLLPAAEIDGRIGWGYAFAPAEGKGSDARPAVRLAVYAFRLDAGGRVAWRAVLRGAPASEADAAAVAEAWAASLTGNFPAALASRVEGRPRWLDDRTVVVDGSAEGLGALIDGAFTRIGGALPGAASPRR